MLMHEVDCLAYMCDADFVIWAAYYSAFRHKRTPKHILLSLPRSINPGAAQPMVRLYMERYWLVYACVIDTRWIDYISHVRRPCISGSVWL